MHDTHYIQIVKDIILEITNEYLIHNNNKQYVCFAVNNLLIFELLKMKVKSETIILNEKPESVKLIWKIIFEN